ncbi:transcriptional regulator GcvA [Gellertiella hungarica]|uniref:LysR family glycine cleavage system transcriptional activator n=1 Tax=Gellertiella hungarica TaxID=1572859 RepID=A0A7W6NLX8_9HYPH|nr:transcriptional regulator GcvA [Gellertiella hungarica]MBB4066995.1 LysR family glycine cleavage system transcriptional activator [Gellertiella hungarica]
MRSAPGTRTLRTLAAAGRHLNFTRAADELGLTPAAVSFQIKELETTLGYELFQRTGRSMVLTDAGKILCAAAEEAIDTMNRAVSRVARLKRDERQLKVTVDPQFATKWLMRHIVEFRRRHPEIDVRFDVSYELRDFEIDDVDIAIRFGTGNYPGCTTDRLFSNVIAPVCSPRLLKGERPIRTPSDLLQHTLAHIHWTGDGLTWPTWSVWMAAAGIPDFDDDNTLVFEKSSDAIEAAMTGEVVALADFSMVANDLSEGRLVRPFDLGVTVPPEFGYYLVYPTAETLNERVAVFRDWVLEAARAVQGREAAGSSFP